MRYLFAVAFFLMMAGTAPAQEIWMNYGKENDITDIAVHGDYIWCATANGLVRWDRRDMSYRKYTMRDGLPHSVINSIDITPDGTVWCGTDVDIVRFDGSTWQAIRMPGYYYDGLKIQSSAIGPDGSVWISTSRYNDFLGEYGELLRYYDGTWTTFDHTHLTAVTSYGNIESIAVAPDNTVWLRGYTGIGCSNPAGEFRLLNAVQGHSDVLCIANGTVWAGTDSGLVTYDGNSWTSLSFPSETPSKQVRAVAVQPDGVVWAGTASGLLRHDGATWKVYTTADGLPVNSISALSRDDSGVLWVGTPDGLCTFDGVSFRTWRTTEELIDKTVTSLAFEPNGTVWVGTPSGISRYNGKGWRSFTAADGLPDNAVRSLTVTPKGDVWAATSKGAARFYGSGWKTYTAGDGLPDSTVYSIKAGNDNSVWFSTQTGTTRFDGSTWRTFTRADSCMANSRSLAVSRNGFVWVTDGETISRFDGKTWKNYVIFPDHSTGWMLSISGGPDSTLFYLNTYNYGTVHNPGYGLKLYTLESSPAYQWGGASGRSGALAAGLSGDAWVGTADGTLCHIVGGSISAHYAVDQAITTIAIAPDGAVWCGTGMGLVRYGPPLTLGVESGPALPKEFAVMGNYPNPFNPSTTISFTLPRSTRAELSVYSITGQRVRTLLSRPMDAGAHSAVWDGRDDSGKMVSSGIYITQLRSGKQVSSHKMLLIK